ncbi:MAG: aspartate kinase, partial [Pygmaiobacter sp.]
MNVVHKYGGSSVATIEKIRAVAVRVAAIKRTGVNIALVASAMGKTTNDLIALASELSPTPSPREMDSLLSTGEQKTVALLAMALEALGVPAVSLTGFQGGFITNQNFRHAKIRDIRIENVQKYIDAGYVPVLAGFQGIDEDGNITTLGRGGSDTTAVALAAKLGWDCEIYTDVEGIYTADPRLCPRAKKLAHIRCDEMMEMSSLGAGVLETRSVELAKKYGVRLFLGKALEADHTKGTYIMDTMTFEEMPVTGLSIKDDCSLIQARGRGAGGALTCELFALLAQLDINVDMISQQMESAE